jgi:hypothetical protein
MSAIGVEREGPLAVLTIDSPPLNLFDEQLMRELEAAGEPRPTRAAERPRRAARRRRPRRRRGSPP